MGRIVSGLSTVLWCGVALWMIEAAPARAEVFNTARTLKPRAISLGLEPQVILTRVPEYQLNLHGGLGLSRGVDLGIRYGLPLMDSPLSQYLGLDVEVELLHDRVGSPALSFSTGVHVEDWTWYVLDATLMASKVVGRFEPYGALDLDLTLPPGAILDRWRMVGGLNFHVSRVTELMFEIGFGLRDASSYLSAGINFYL